VRPSRLYTDPLDRSTILIDGARPTTLRPVDERPAVDFTVVTALGTDRKSIDPRSTALAMKAFVVMIRVARSIVTVVMIARISAVPTVSKVAVSMSASIYAHVISR